MKFCGFCLSKNNIQRLHFDDDWAGNVGHRQHHVTCLVWSWQKRSEETWAQLSRRLFFSPTSPLHQHASFPSSISIAWPIHVRLTLAEGRGAIFDPTAIVSRGLGRDSRPLRPGDVTGASWLDFCDRDDGHQIVNIGECSVCLRSALRSPING